MKLVAAIGCLCAGALAAVGCADGLGGPTSPSATAAVSGPAVTAPGTGENGPRAVASSSSASPRSGDLHVTKECSGYTGGAGSFCTITASNVAAIEVGSRIVYASAEGPEGLDSDVVLDLPGPGNNTAFGHCTLNAVTSRCTFSGGTGKFTWFQARVDVSASDDYSEWYWDGTYSFMPQD